MPPKLKQKPKDGGLTAKQLQNLISIVKDYWPDYEITPENIMGPTKDFVMSFYEKCAEDLENKLAFLNQNHVEPHYPPNCEPEQILFYKLSRIPLLRDADFRLGDLYVFDPKRLKCQMLLIMHFLMTAENQMNQLSSICNEVFESCELLWTNTEKIKEQKELKNDKMMLLTLAKKENRKLKEAAEVINANHEKTLKAIADTDQKCSGLVAEVEKLNSQIENLQLEVQNHEKNESELKAEVVTQEDYDHLKTILDCLLKDHEKLEENCDMNGLLELKSNFEYLGKCLQELQQLSLPDELLQLSSLRDQLKREQKDLTYALTTNNSSKAEIKQLENELEKRKQNFTQEIKTLQNELQILTEDGMMKERKLKTMFQKEETNYKIEIDQLQEGLKKIEEDFMKLKLGIEKNIKGYLDMKEALLKSLKEL